MDDVHAVTNDRLYEAVEAGIDRVRDRIIEELLMSSDTKSIDEILDDIQTAILSAEREKKIYRSWIFENKIPEEFIYDPEEEEEIYDDFEDEEDDE